MAVRGTFSKLDRYSQHLSLDAHARQRRVFLCLNQIFTIDNFGPGL